MEKDAARVLLSSLLGRIEPDSATGKYQLRGVISAHELAAVTLALDEMGGPVSEPGKILRPSVRDVKLPSPALALTAPQDEDVILCLDFGTAMSKGFAIRNGARGKLDLIPLRLGQRAGEPQAIHPVSSSLWIDGQGMVFVGAQAVGRGQPSGSRRREDSLKRFLTLPTAGADLDAKGLEPSVNPTTVFFTEEDALTLYFGYLTDLAVSELEDQGISRYVKRRFAVPCWDSERRTWGEKLLKTLLARAVIVADYFHGKWEAGILLDEAKAVIDRVKNLPKIPLCLIAEGISEPVAAGSSFLELQEQKDRKLMMVVDVGAGTCDFAMFVVAKPIWSSKYAFHLIPGSTKALSQAGDRLDSILVDAILSNAGITTSDPQRAQIQNDLQHRIRGIKERLCRDGSITEALSNGTPFTMMRDQFMQLPRVREFAELLQKTFDEVVRSVDPSHFMHLSLRDSFEVLLTGGGSGLDMVKKLASGQVYVKDKIIQRREANGLPQNLRRGSSALRDDYPQLAVAIGGALPVPLSEGGKAIAPGFHKVEIGGFYQKGL